MSVAGRPVGCWAGWAGPDLADLGRTAL